MNTFKTALLLTALTLFLIFIGGHFGGRNGMVLAFLVAAGMNFFSYFYSDKMALSMYRAQPVTREQLPRVYQILERIVPRMALPMPRIYVIPDDSPNAFATGRNPKHAAVAVTQGILNLLNDEELEGVLAHELGHVRLKHHEPELRARQRARAAGLPPDDAAEARREFEADFYSGVYLCGTAALWAQPEVAELAAAIERGHAYTSDALWALSIRLGQRFRVTGSLLATRLTHLGLVEKHGRTLRTARPLARTAG